MLPHSVNNPILALSGEHRFIFEQIGRLEGVFAMDDGKAAACQLATIEPALMPFLLRHFRLEEEILFSGALEALPVGSIIRVVLQLTREHGELARWASELFTWARSGASVEATVWQARRQEAKAFSDLTRRHAQVEVTDLFPKISGNPRCCQLIETALARSGFSL